jgi:glycosyltransferase involved in cell wall biosynthesis
MFSINPLFPDRVMGGAPKQLQKVATYLGEQGHNVTILCTRRADSQTPFRWHSRVRVKPLLRFHQPFPQPYAAPAYDLANALQDVAEHLQTADRFYMHDGEFLFPYAYQQVPTVVSLRDNVYPETMLGGFLFQGDTLIAISNYSRNFYLATIGRFFPDLAQRTRVIPNGINWQKFKPTSPGDILDIVPVNPARDAIVIHPHRPEPSKGLPQTIAVAARLVQQHSLHNLKVLVPRWLDVGLSAEVRAFYTAMQEEIAAHNLQEHFLFHDWVPQDLMPQYYSLGDVTLALGHFVESFGNTPYESLGCGTPAVVARVSTHRELLPDHLLDKVHFGDVETAASLTAAIIKEKRPVPPKTLRYLHTHYSVEAQLEGYAHAILHAEKRGPLPYRHTPLDAATRYTLAPWCYQWAEGFYHDFLATHRPLPALSDLLARHPQGFTTADADSELIQQWYREGYVVPLE